MVECSKIIWFIIIHFFRVSTILLTTSGPHFVAWGLFTVVKLWQTGSLLQLVLGVAAKSSRLNIFFLMLLAMFGHMYLSMNSLAFAILAVVYVQVSPNIFPFVRGLCLRWLGRPHLCVVVMKLASMMCKNIVQKVCLWVIHFKHVLRVEL